LQVLYISALFLTKLVEVSSAAKYFVYFKMFTEDIPLCLKSYKIKKLFIVAV